MIKNILWDFDGVILDSMQIKGDAFLELFSKYDHNITQKLVNFHYENGGMSRFDKIEYFYTDILHQTISKDKVYQLANQFASIIKTKILNHDNLIEDSLNFIFNNFTIYDFHIVSGAEEKELKSICDYFDLTKYFITINGSPTKKEILIKSILKKYDYLPSETILIGDAINDYNAASLNNISFYGFNNEILKGYSHYINSFKGIEFE